MKVSKLAIAVAVGSLLAGSNALAQQPFAGTPARQVAYEYDGYYADEPQAAEDAAEDGAADDAADEADHSAGHSTCSGEGGGSCCSTGTCSSCCGDDEPFKLFDCCFLDRCGTTISGFASASYYWNVDEPRDNFNGPVTFNDRDSEAQLNQAYIYAERLVDTGGCGSDLGGRIDLLYGTDWRFTPALGLEINKDGTADWNQNQRFYGAALPQVYAEMGYNDLRVKAGRFYTILGYEVVPANGNFFSTHSYSMQYGEPFTHTGVLASMALNDAISVSSGIHRGWDQWQDINESLGYLGGVTWTISDATTLAASMSWSEEDLSGDADRNIYSFVLTRKLCDNLTAVGISDIGHQQGAAGLTPGGADAEWYSLGGYLIYDINDCWSFGWRNEWFRDDDGFRVAGFGSIPGDFANRGFTSSGFAGDFYEISMGLNYQRNSNLLIRNEVRWDWYDGLDGSSLNPANGGRPFDDGSDSSQMLIGTNLVYSF